MAVQELLSPVDGTVIQRRDTATEAQIDRILDTAMRARASWRATSLAERAAWCERLVAWFEANADDIGRELTMQMGRPVRYTPNEIRRGFQERARHMASIAPASLADVAVEPKDGFTRFIRREPVGTVARAMPRAIVC